MHIPLMNKTATSYTNRDGKIVRVGDMWKLEFETDNAFVITRIVQGKFDRRWRVVALSISDGDSIVRFAPKFCENFYKVA